VFTIDWAEADSLTLRLSHPTIKNIIWKNKIADFIKEGGGYFGHCAGAVIMSSGFINKPDTLVEKQQDRASMHISQVKIYHQTCYPILDQLGDPEKIASGAGAYYWFSGWDANNESHHFGGCSLDVVIDKSYPIFDDVSGDTRRIRWGGGPVLVPPEQSNNVKVVGYYPSEEISDNVSTQVHAWKYTGRFFGFLRGFLRTKIGEGLFNRFYFTPYKATDWEMMDKIVQTYHANKPFMTIETYPNENQGRIVLSGGHPEIFVWWGGHIEEVKDTSENSLFNGLHYWTGITEVDYNYNKCIVRREAAWASKKVPDNDLPQVYGPSQVSDVHPYDQSSEFTIIGNAEVSDGIESLGLYYRYSHNNSTWSPWLLYDTDFDGSNGWSWKFNAPNGTGHYQFYSLRHVEYENEWLNETAPPGPDAIARVIE